MKFNTRPPMAVLTRPLSRSAAESAAVRPSRLLRPLRNRAHVRLESPRVFWDPRMPGGWTEESPVSMPDQAA